jgi:hypothetical protein
MESTMKAEQVDATIREALKSADRKGKLSVVAAVTGIAGGQAALKKIMKSVEPLSIMDRAMLGMHLNLPLGAA